METYQSDDGTIIVNVTTSTLDEDFYNRFVEYTEAAQAASDAQEMLMSYAVGGIGIVVGIMVALVFLRRF